MTTLDRLCVMLSVLPVAAAFSWSLHALGLHFAIVWIALYLWLWTVLRTVEIIKKEN